MYYVYVLQNKYSDKIYIGQTNDLKRRLSEHNSPESNKGHHTSRFDGRWELVYSESCGSRSAAIVRERQLKSHGGRDFIRSMLKN